MKKPLPIGIEDYKELIDKSYYYVDKTLMIKEILDQKGKVNLFTRPRRFGKTLTLSMIKTWFEQDMDLNGNITDNSQYFKRTKIMEAGDEYTCQIGQYPVISLSLKSSKQPNFEMAYKCLLEQIAEEYKRHRYVLDTDNLIERDKKKFCTIMEQCAENSDYATSLAFLSKCLKSYHRKNVVILLDEYDVPLENSFFKGFYEQMTDFIRSLFESALKTNDALEFAVITGCLRISKESIFTGLNNLEIISILNPDYGEYFGFTQPEVDRMLRYYRMESKKEELRNWYDGYLFGKAEVYNPWSVVNYVKSAVSDINAFPKPYWSNTSSNDIVRRLIEQADDTVKGEIEALIAGGIIEKPVHEDITYEDVYKTQDTLWNFLFFTGYLKAVSQRFEVDTIYFTLTIPNEEVRYVYRNTIKEWFTEEQKKYDPTPFYEGLKNGNCEQIEDFINEQLAASISYYDSAENFYHGYLLGLVNGIGGCNIKSNREQGNGRPDIVISPYIPKKPAIILEIKYAKRFTQMEEKCKEALKQIEDNHYADELLDEGYQDVLKYGICFCKKGCKVMK